MTGPEYRSIRRQLGLTQSGLAELLGVTKKTIGLREREITEIHREAELAIRSIEQTKTHTKP